MIIPQDQLQALIVQSGLVHDKELAELLAYAKSSNTPLDSALVEKNLITDETLGMMIANYLHMPYVRLSKLSIPDDIVSIVPEKVAKRLKIIPFEKTVAEIKVATSNPYNGEILKLLSQKTGQKIVPYLATDKEIYDTLHIYRKDLQKSFEKLLKDEVEASEGAEKQSEAPISKIVDLLFEYSYQDKASDVHIEPEEKNALVRFRIDGILHDVLVISRVLHERIVARIKVLSKMRTDEHLAPQDGKIRTKVGDDDLDIRVSVLPIAEGEKIVMRLLSTHTGQLTLKDLGMSETDLKKVSNAYNRSFGMILSTGPTGSGKTSTIYSILRVLNVREKNITTIEDPVEYRIKGVNQIQVNPKTNLTFANGLRSILRQDPNIVFVGEIRDGETAAIAVNAALTGHLVVSTLHTNDAATALPRLIDMKIEPFLVASTVNVIIAQRLVRKICENCRVSFVITEKELVDSNIPVEIVQKHYIFAGEAREVRIYKGKGCKVCHATGYAGRIGIYEVLQVDKDVRKLIGEKNDSDVIRKAAIDNGMTTMLDDGLQKVAKGITTIEEVLRVTKVEAL